jgi:FMN phosphatase YigB (HAD superfamily)
MSKPRLIIFDCDGVLVDSEVLSARVEADALGALGIRISAEEMLQRFTGIASREAYALLEAEQGIRLPKRFGGQVLERLHAIFELELEPVRGIRAALAAIDLPVCVASSSEPVRIERSLRAVGPARALCGEAVQREHGGARQAGARPVPARRRAHGRRARRLPGDRGQRARRPGGHRRRHAGDRFRRRQPLPP